MGMKMTEPEFEVAILGAGFAGVGMASRLKMAGLDSFVILEKGDAVGGTWRDNRYPGCSCDVPSHLYSFSFEPNPEWSSVYSPQEEIRDYIEGIVARRKLGPHLRLGCAVVEARWDERRSIWRIQTTQGPLTCRVFIAGWGQLNRPFTPAIEGRTAFAGLQFHSAQWPADVDLTGKRVASIGTGASAAQYVPEVAKIASRLVIFQRSAPWVVPRQNRLGSCRVPGW